MPPRAPVRVRTAAAVFVVTVGVLAAAGCGSDAKAPAERAPGTGQTSGTSPGRFTLVATGDVIPYPSIMGQAQSDAGGGGYDFRQILSGVRPVVSAADLAICHHETVYGKKEGPFTGYPTFQSPSELAAGLKATGYDMCSTASNHTLDAGFDGVHRTLDALDAAGVGHAGSARSAAEAKRPAFAEVAGAKVALLSYTYATNGIPLPEGKPWAVNLIDSGKVIADARAARKAGADIVLVSMHWGTEWQQQPDEQQIQVAKQVTGSRSGGRPDIDLVIGTHNHVVQPYEKVNGTWVVYGLGDQMASFTEKVRGNEGSIARFTFVRKDGTDPGEADKNVEKAADKAPGRAPGKAPGTSVGKPAGDRSGNDRAGDPARAAEEGDAGERGRRWTVEKAEFLPQMSQQGPPFRVVDVARGLRAEPDRKEYEAVRQRVSEAVLSRGAAADGLALADE